MNEEAWERAELLAKLLARICVRDTYLEDLHSEGTPIGQEEMKKLIKEVVNKLTTFLYRMELSEGIPGWFRLFESPGWDPAELDKGLNIAWDRAEEKIDAST